MTKLEDQLASGYRLQWDETLERDILVPPAVPLEFIPHPSAPLFSSGLEGQQTMDQLVAELQSPNFTLTPEIVDLLQQASYVSLYFFLKYIAGAYGPYGDLTDHLHVEVCNYRQRMLHAGARGAVFLPRSFYKSTVCTHGAIAWELLRDPNLRVGLAASNMDMAEQFMTPARLIYEDNPLVEALFPDHCPKKGEKGNILAKKWNSHQVVMPNRKIHSDNPSIKCVGAGGAIAGNHFDLLSVDDLVSEKELDSERGAGADMIKKGQWFSTNQDTCLVSPRRSRVFVAATRYSLDDPYEDIFTELKSQHGYWDEIPYEVNQESGIWDVYYRMAIERDEYVFPEKVGKEELDRIREKDPWKYYTQYLNNPHSAQVSDFQDYNVHKCELDFTNEKGYTILVNRGNTTEEIPLANCEVNIGLDPAASETKVSNRVSRSAIVVKARDHKDRHFYIDGAVGYMAPTVMYDNIFRLYKKYRAYVKSTNIEAHGAFKIVWNSIRELQVERQTFIGMRRIAPLPNKDAKLRDFLQPLLEFNLVYACPPVFSFIEAEIKAFPGGILKDTLDAMEIAERDSVRPMDAEEQNYQNGRERAYRGRIRSRAGY